MNPASPAPPPIPDYELVRQIGRGSYGEVWLARSVVGVFRAIKCVWRERFTDFRPYEREIQGITRFSEISLRDRSQLAVLHVGRDPQDRFFWYVMELADAATGGRDVDPEKYEPLTLRSLVAQRGQLPVAEVVTLGVALARALATLHAAGLVHRDVKPSNIIFVSGVPKLADVGLVANASKELTFVGTEGFVPPEGPGAGTADIYSLGKVLYELATGLDRQSYPRLPEDLSQRADRAQLLELNEVILKACEPELKNRFKSATELLDELLLLQAGKSVRRLRFAERRIRWAVQGLAVLAAIALVAGGGAWAERRRANIAEAERDALVRRTVYAAQLAQAKRALDQEDFGHARQILAAAADPEGQSRHALEWRVLNHQAQGDPCEVIRESGAPIDKLALSPDGQLIAVHDESKTVTLLDAATHRELRRFTGIHRLAGFSRDGQWLVGTDPSLALQRWHVSDGTPGGEAHGGGVFRPIGPYGADGIVAFIDPVPAEHRSLTMIVWDFAAAREVRRQAITVPGYDHNWEFFRAKMSGDGSRLALACIGSRTERVYLASVIDLADATRPLACQTWNHSPATVGWSKAADGSPEAWEIDDAGTSLRWSADTGKWAPGPALPSMINNATGEDDGRLLFGCDTRLQLASPDGASPRRFRGHTGSVSDLLILPGGKQALSASVRGELRLWSLQDEAKSPVQYSGKTPASLFVRFAFSPDGREIFCPYTDSGIAGVDAATLALRETIPGFLWACAATPEGVWGIPPGHRALAFWDRAAGRITRQLAAADTEIVRAMASGDLATFVIVRGEGEVSLLDVRSGTSRVVIPAGQENWIAPDFDHPGKRVCVVGSYEELVCFEVTSGRQLWRRHLPGLGTDVRWIPPGDGLAALLTNGTILVLDPASGATLKTIPAIGGKTVSLAVTPAGDRAVVADVYGETHIFELPSWTYLTSMTIGPDTKLKYIRVSPDNRAIVALADSGTLKITAAP